MLNDSIVVAQLVINLHRLGRKERKTLCNHSDMSYQLCINSAQIRREREGSTFFTRVKDVWQGGSLQGLGFLLMCHPLSCSSLTGCPPLLVESCIATGKGRGLRKKSGKGLVFYQIGGGLWLAIGTPCGQDITPYNSKPIFWKIIVLSNYCWENKEKTFHHFRLHIHTHKTNTCFRKKVYFRRKRKKSVWALGCPTKTWFFEIKKPNPLLWYLGGRLKDPKRIFDFENI